MMGPSAASNHPSTSDVRPKNAMPNVTETNHTAAKNAVRRIEEI
jgi:hypothetical protein